MMQKLMRKAVIASKLTRPYSAVAIPEEYAFEMASSTVRFGRGNDKAHLSLFLKQLDSIKIYFHLRCNERGRR